MRDLFAPLRPCFSSGGARVEIDASGSISDDVAAGLEGFTRPLWGLAADPGGGTGGDWAACRQGLAAGCDPGHREYWGAPRDRDQRLVEAAAIAFALCVAPAKLWEPLDDSGKENVAAWLATARGRLFHDNNWRLFELLIDLALRKVGGAGNEARSAAARAAVESMYVADGWYRDGRTRRLDHYNAFGFHFYALILASLEPDTAFAATARERAVRFAADYVRLFADDGAMLPFGRSLSYRFATAGFWGALAFAGVEALPWGVIKGLYLRQLRWWATRPMARRDRLLGPGFAYPLPALAEAYGNPASSYWAFKAFLPLALASDHPFWAAEEAPTPNPTCPVALAAPGLIVSHAPGHCAALAAGQDNPHIRHGAEKYARFAYSSRYGFGLDEDRHAFDLMSAESMILFCRDGHDPRGRTACEAAAVAGDLIWSRWRPWADVTVETFGWWAGLWQVRVHRVSTPVALSSIEGGFAIARPADDRAEVVRTGRGAMVATSADMAGILDCGMLVRDARLRVAQPNTNIMNARALVPQLAGLVPAGTQVLAAAVLATPDIEGGRRAWAAPPTVPPIETLAERIRVEGRPIGAHALA